MKPSVYTSVDASKCFARLFLALDTLLPQGPVAPYPPFTAKQAELGKELVAKSLEIRKQITDMSAPAEPFKIMGNLYFVGSPTERLTC